MTSTPTTPVDNVVIATKGLQDRNINILAGRTVENKGKLILIKYLVVESISQLFIAPIQFQTCEEKKKNRNRNSAQQSDSYQKIQIPAVPRCFLSTIDLAILASL